MKNFDTCTSFSYDDVLAAKCIGQVFVDKQCAGGNPCKVNEFFGQCTAIANISPNY